MPKTVDLPSVLMFINSCSDAELRIINDEIATVMLKSPTISEALLEHKKTSGYECPYCSGKAVKNGKNVAGHQMYRCKDCGKNFTANTCTPLQRTRKNSSTWRTFLEMLLMDATINELTGRCGISQTTAFRWRNKVFDALIELSNNMELQGTIEADETFFKDSYKGNHAVWPAARDSRSRGSSASLRGISHEQICIPCLMDSDGKYVAKITNRGKINAPTLSKAFAGNITPGSVIVSDSATAYRRFSKSVGADLHQIPRGKRSVGSLNIQKINSLHSSIESRVNHVHRGVSSKYMNGYIAFTCWKQTHSGSLPELTDQLIADIVKATRVKTCIESSARPFIPVIK